VTATEGWGGSAKKLHWIKDATALCGRAAPDLIPFVDRSITTRNGTHNFCRRCMKLTNTTPVIMLEISARWS